MWTNYSIQLPLLNLMFIQRRLSSEYRLYHDRYLRYTAFVILFTGDTTNLCLRLPLIHVSINSARFPDRNLRYFLFLLLDFSLFLSQLDVDKDLVLRVKWQMFWAKWKEAFEADVETVGVVGRCETFWAFIAMDMFVFHGSGDMARPVATQRIHSMLIFG